jgi:ech hydrogenase subunit A
MLGHEDTIAYEKWPEYDEALCKEDVIEIGVQVTGKVRGTIGVTEDDTQETALEKAKKVENVAKTSEMLSMSVHVVLMIAVCALFPIVSNGYVNQLVASMYAYSGQVLSNVVLMILVSIILVVFAIPMLAYFNSKSMDITIKKAYMAGVNTGDNSGFVDAFGENKEAYVSNYYFEDFLGVDKNMGKLQLFTTLWIIVSFAIIIGGEFL